MGELCDVCNETAHFACSNCYESVYCSQKCQSTDWEDHSIYDCYHPDEMTDEHVLEEIGLFYPDIASSITPNEARNMLIEAQGNSKRSTRRRQRRQRRKGQRRERKDRKKRKRRGAVAGLAYGSVSKTGKGKGAVAGYLLSGRNKKKNAKM